MTDFFDQLDMLHATYQERLWTVDEWRIEIEHHLEMIDDLLPRYTMIVDSERVTVAYRERSLIPDCTHEEDTVLLRDVALRVASLFYALDGALSEGF